MTTEMRRELARKQPANLPTQPESQVIDGQVGRPLTRGQLLFLRAGAFLLLTFAVIGMAVATARTY